MDNTLWALGRVSGIVALILFTGTVVLGILTRSGRPLLSIPRYSLTLIHRNFALLATIFLALHVGTLVLDSFAKLTLADVVVPFLGSYRPFWQGLGTVAFDLVVAVVGTSLLRRRVGVRAFRAVHWFTYAMWPIALAHALGNGTDGTSKFFLLLAICSLISVGAALVWRFSTNFPETAKTRQEELQ